MYRWWCYWWELEIRRLPTPVSRTHNPDFITITITHILSYRFSKTIKPHFKIFSFLSCLCNGICSKMIKLLLVLYSDLLLRLHSNNRIYHNEGISKPMQWLVWNFLFCFKIFRPPLHISVRLITSQKVTSGMFKPEHHVVIICLLLDLLDTILNSVGGDPPPEKILIATG